MGRIAAVFGVGAALTTLLTAGCASGAAATESTFDDFDPTGATKLGPGSSVTHEAPAASDVGAVTPGSACATSSAGTQPQPISLVFMVDRSGSMGGGSIEVKWGAAVDTLKTFFGDPASSNIKASLAFFASADECNVASYATPAVAMRQLPDSEPFGTALDLAAPEGGTPTLPAVQGALQYAQTVAAASPGEKVALVLVTDGDPNDCDSTPENVSAEAAAVAETIKTYVVGVGDLAQKLDAVAAGGGTFPHIQVNTTSATETSADLRRAISKIKAAQLGCNYPLPAPPSGESLDVNAVNVDYSPAGSGAQTLPYSADCKNPGGWHYDSVESPSQIVMCDDICWTLQNDITGGKVDIVFGCTTQSADGTRPH